jgi:hypothetical protein
VAVVAFQAPALRERPEIPAVPLAPVVPARRVRGVDEGARQPMETLWRRTHLRRTHLRRDRGQALEVDAERRPRQQQAPAEPLRAEVSPTGQATARFHLDS